VKQATRALWSQRQNIGHVRIKADTVAYTRHIYAYVRSLYSIAHSCCMKTKNIITFYFTQFDMPHIKATSPASISTCMRPLIRSHTVINYT